MKFEINAASEGLVDIVTHIPIVEETSLGLNSWLISALVSLIICVILLKLIKGYLSSQHYALKRLEQELSSNTPNTRALAHQINSIIKNKALNAKQQQQLKQLRFAKSEPTVLQIQQLIKSIQHV
ncbi:MAG: hypothetical protein ISR69_00335 [Gammaproteobacteria bacterium]|nr:hypothetical protein [Gammaproteobacteria bacterium]